VSAQTPVTPKARATLFQKRALKQDGEDVKPSVLIFEASARAELVREVCAGLEEESVLFAVVSRGDSTAEALAFSAANESLLGVGVGIFGSSAVMQMKNFSVDNPVFRVDNAKLSEYRKLGINAARAVKGGMFI